MARIIYLLLPLVAALQADSHIDNTKKALAEYLSAHGQLESHEWLLENGNDDFQRKDVARTLSNLHENVTAYIRGQQNRFKMIKEKAKHLMTSRNGGRKLGSDMIDFIDEASNIGSEIGEDYAGSVKYPVPYGFLENRAFYCFATVPSLFYTVVNVPLMILYFPIDLIFDSLIALGLKIAGRDPVPMLYDRVVRYPLFHPTDLLAFEKNCADIVAMTFEICVGLNYTGH